MFFKEFSVVPYQFNVAGKSTLRMVKDITQSIKLSRELTEKLSYYSEYDIVEGETPERIAEKIYGNANYHWLIMLVNDKFDYSEDWPLTNDALFEFVEKKYGVTMVNQQHMVFGKPHYETELGAIVDQDYPGALPITNYEYEFRLNEKKRKIKIVNPRVVNQVASELKSLI